MDEKLLDLRVYIRGGQTICDCRTREYITNDTLFQLLHLFQESVKNNNHVEIRKAK